METGFDEMFNYSEDEKKIDELKKQKKMDLEEIVSEKRRLENAFDVEIEKINSPAHKKQKSLRTRRLILIGSCIERSVIDGEFDRVKLRDTLNRYLVRDVDRTLFGMESLSGSGLIE